MVLENKIRNQPFILIYIFFAVSRRFWKKVYPFGGKTEDIKENWRYQGKFPEICKLWKVNLEKINTGNYLLGRKFYLCFTDK
jgi:hypothetical protein